MMSFFATKNAEILKNNISRNIEALFFGNLTPQMRITKVTK